MNAADRLPAGRGQGRPSSRLDRAQRDAALRRVRSITKAVAVGSVAAAAGIGVYVSRALPGHSSTTRASTTGAGTSGTPVTPATAPSSVAPTTPGTSVSGTGSGSGDTGSGTSSSGTSSSGSSSSGNGSASTLTPPTNVPAPTQQQAPVVSGST